jgi:nucleoside-diphosphate-sugar epimerase
MKVLVTGATGFLGSYLTRALIKRGDTVRILARNAERAGQLQAAGAEVRLGDLNDPASIRGLADGMETVFHLARSATAASMQAFDRMDVAGTEQLLSEAKRAGVQRFVYVGTLAGYALAQQPDGAVINEHSAFDETGQLGNYVRAKALAEAAALAANSPGGLETVVVRLGLVCGVGAGVFPAHVCQPFAKNRVIVFGDGGVPLPLVYVDNAVDALLLAASTLGIGGESFNVVDDDTLTQNEYVALLQRSAGGAPRVLRLPAAAYYILGLVSELAARLRKKEPTTNRYRIKTRLARVRWDSAKARHVLKWQPKVPLRDGLTRVFRDYADARMKGG